MPISRRVLCLAYGLIALLALVTTWGNALSYVPLGVVGDRVGAGDRRDLGVRSNSVAVTPVQYLA